MEKIQENMCKQSCSYVFVPENYIKARLLVFSPFSAHFYPPLRHNGKRVHFHLVSCMYRSRGGLTFSNQSCAHGYSGIAT